MSTQLVRIETDVPAATRVRSDEGMLSLWLKSKSGADGSPNTARAYSRIGEAFLAALGTGLREATVEDVLAAADHLRIRVDGKPASASTVATHVAVVKSLLRFAHRVGYTRFNAGELLKVKAPPVGRAKRIMGKVDIQFLIRAAGSPRNQLLLAVGYYAGLRVSELASLTWGSFVEREGGRVQIAGLVGKGGKEREVLLPASVAGLIREARGNAEAAAPVFVTRHGAISERTVNVIIKAAAKRAGLPAGFAAKVSPHWLRHAHASHALDNGAPISLVSQTLGHSSIKTTSVYAHAKPGDSSALYLD
jgi:integrase/recombinase XerD